VKRLALALLLVGFSAFADDGFPDGWKHLTFPSVDRATSYAVVHSGSTLVIEAQADCSASVLVRCVKDPPDLLHWKWRVDRTIFAGNGKTRSTDDFAARVWVGFDGNWDDASRTEKSKAKEFKKTTGLDAPLEWIHYVWCGRGRPRFASFDEPYQPNRVKCIALRAAEDELQTWYDEERDPRADFRRLFGHEPGKIMAIAVMTDGDDTQSQAHAFYSEIGFVSSASR